MRVSAAIMAHPARIEMVGDLRTRLDRDVPVVWDEVGDRHDTGLRSLQAYDPTADYHVVVQDDVLPAPDLLAGIERALAHIPDGCPASFYVGKVKPFRGLVERAVTDADGASWIVMDGIYWGPCIAVPTDTIDRIARWWWGQGRIHNNYDKRLSKWFERHGRRCWYSWPSLVDHRGDVSLVRGHTAQRNAHRFVDSSALAVDWTGEVVELRQTARLDRRRQQLAGRR